MLLNFLKEAVPWEGVTLGCWVCSLTFQPCPADTAPTLVSTDSHSWIADSWGGRSASPWPWWHLHIKNRAPIHPTSLPLNGGGGKISFPLILLPPRRWKVTNSSPNCLIAAGWSQKLNSPLGSPDTRRREVGRAACQPIPFPSPPCASWGRCSAAH